VSEDLICYGTANKGNAHCKFRLPPRLTRLRMALCDNTYKEFGAHCKLFSYYCRKTGINKQTNRRGKRKKTRRNNDRNNDKMKTA
jgi:hypothetical protein